MNVWSIALSVLVALAGCSATPHDDYSDFLARTAQERENACLDGAPDRGIGGDLTRADGWLVRALLSGGIAIGLRIVFAPHPEGNKGKGTRLEVRIWLDDQAKDDDPLVVTDTTVREDGTYTLVANPLNLPPEVLNAEAAVVADVTLDSAQIDAESWCGIARGSVVSPLNLDLEGSTFAARPWKDGLDIETVPFACPGTCTQTEPSEQEEPMSGGASVEVEKPEVPQLSLSDNLRRDISGDWLLAATLGVLNLNLWVSLNFREDPDGKQASVDGAIRLADDPIDSAPRSVFFAPVDDKGMFEVWIPNFSLDVNAAQIAADILLVAGTFEQGWCGLAAGEVRQPFELDLAGSTFRAHPWQPGTDVPQDLDTACPSSE